MNKSNVRAVVGLISQGGRFSIDKLSQFQEKINYKFVNENMLHLALAHSSHANECGTESNERLEFLGDSVLSIAVSEFLYNEFPAMPEGDLSRLRASVVCEDMLAKKAFEINLGEYLTLGRGEENTGGRTRESLLADAYEALLGAIYLDSGLESAKKFILTNMSENIFEMKKSYKISDRKTALQELIQRDSKAPIEYVLVQESGPDHDKVFITEVMHEGKYLGKGAGKSKKESEQNAAFEALKRLM